MKMMTTVAARPWNEPMVIENLVKMCEDSATTDVAVMYMCHPEGLPLMEKIAESAGQFRKIKSKLAPCGIRSGIMIQTLLDHGERFQPLSPVTFQRITGFDGTVSRACFCPLDEDFLDYVRQMISVFSKESPDFFLVDDDVRLDNHSPARWACACPLHVKLFNRFAGMEYSRDQIFAAMERDDELGQSVRRQWQNSGDESLLMLARIIREAIDQIAPDIRCGKCTSGGKSTFRTVDIARALAGSTKPFIRLAGAYYCADGYAYFADAMINLAAQSSLLNNDKDIELLSESDTCLHTRYHTPAKTLRGHVAGSILAAGIDTPYTWIPGTLEWIPEDVEAFSKTMKTGLRFFSELKKISRQVRWLGPTLVMNDRRKITMPWRKSNPESCPISSWAGSICGKFGIPFTVNNPDSSIYMLDGTAVYDLTRQEIENILGKAVLLDGPAALILSKWGYSELMGVEVKEGDDELRYDYEKFNDDAQLNGDSAGKHHLSMRGNADGVKRLTLLDNKVRIASSFIAAGWYNSHDEKDVSPAITVFENSRGGRVAVYAQNNMFMTFKCFMSDIRKEQFVHILSWLGGQKLPAITLNGVDTYFLYGHDTSTGEYIAAIFNLSQDDVEKTRISFDFGQPSGIRYLTDEGEWEPLCFQYGNGTTSLDITLRTMEPLVLRIKV